MNGNDGKSGRRNDDGGTGLFGSDSLKVLDSGFFDGGVMLCGVVGGVDSGVGVEVEKAVGGGLG